MAGQRCQVVRLRHNERAGLRQVAGGLHAQHRAGAVVDPLPHGLALHVLQLASEGVDQVLVGYDVASQLVVVQSQAVDQLLLSVALVNPDALGLCELLVDTLTVKLDFFVKLL